ncbi:MAG TPA: hypothetical protein VH325_13325 [Bryobacteraceae bacterium]|jgi:hypothetical protein|nr:hypothetical protein [Bryobacteraceae bacterium]
MCGDRPLVSRFLAGFILLPCIAFAAINTWLAAQRDGISHSVSHRTVLSTFRVGREPNLTYDLSIAPCSAAECSFQVRLLAGTEVVTTLDLDWAKARGPVTKDTVDESSGVGDPLQAPTQIVAWSTGEEKTNVSTVARLVRLTPGLNGLLVDQRAGYDVLKRRHDLVVALGRKLVHAWTDAEGNGPTWSTVVIEDSNSDGSQRIIAFDGFRYPSNDQPDRLHYTGYHWNPKTNLIESLPDGPPPLYAVLGGTYKTLSEARAAQAQSSCLGTFWVLKSDGFFKLAQGMFVLTDVSTERPLAMKKLSEIKSCALQYSISVVESVYHPSE